MAELLLGTALGRYDVPVGDPGWYGPESIAWQVHADLASMLVGGMSALLLQTLHPLVVKGVSDHSGYRDDPFGRLRRTAEFIAATTYGGDELASELVHHVRGIHARVRGVASDGRRYRASDPGLLTYVHVTEVSSFLRAHQRYSGRPLLTSEKNRYLAEMAVVAHRLGAREVPLTTGAVREYLRGAREVCEMTAEARETVRFLMVSPIGESVLRRSAYATICEAAIDLLPAWARHQLGLYRPSALRMGLVRPGAMALTAGLRFVAGESPVRRAAERRAAS